MQERHQWVPPPSLCLNLNILVISSFLKIEESFQGWNWIPPFTITCTPPITVLPNFGLEITVQTCISRKKKTKKKTFFFFSGTQWHRSFLGCSNTFVPHCISLSKQAGALMDYRIFSIHPGELGRGPSRKMDPRTSSIQQPRQKHQLNLKTTDSIN